ncbi:hypothetical protein [Cellulosimicrobium arenosum]|nr:hypothetical protein [Cellulosimicrobium arenosum]
MSWPRRTTQEPSSGEGFLQRALDLTSFAELVAVRTEIVRA